MDERPNPVEKDHPVIAEGPSECLRSVVQRNRGGETVGSYAVCSAHPAVIDAAATQASSLAATGTFEQLLPL